MPKTIHHCYMSKSKRTITVRFLSKFISQWFYFFLEFRRSQPLVKLKFKNNCFVELNSFSWNFQHELKTNTTIPWIVSYPWTYVRRVVFFIKKNHQQVAHHHVARQKISSKKELLRICRKHHPGIFPCVVYQIIAIVFFHIKTMATVIFLIKIAFWYVHKATVHCNAVIPW